MKVKYDEYIIKCTYKELTVLKTALRSLEYDCKTHRFNLTKNNIKTEVGKLIKKLHDIEKQHAEQYNKQTIYK